MSNSTQNIKEWAGDPMHPRDSTQNDEIEVDGETYTKWDTQTNWKVKDRVRFLLENLIVDIGVQVTDDYKEKNGIYEGMSIENVKSRDKYTKLFKELLADARREGHELGRLESTEFEVDKVRREVIEELDEKIEKLAELEHEQWWKWAKTLMEKETLSKERIERWHKYMVDYKDLPEDVKEYDRIWARKVLATLRKEGEV